jgi:hypothetical protein
VTLHLRALIFWTHTRCGLARNIDDPDAEPFCADTWGGDTKRQDVALANCRACLELEADERSFYTREYLLRCLSELAEDEEARK